MTRRSALCLLVVITCSAVLVKADGYRNGAQTKMEREAIAFLDALTEAGLKRDVAALDRFYADDYFHTNADGSIMTKAQVLASYKAPTTAVIESDRHDEDKVLIRGSVALVNTRVTIKGRFDNNPYERQWRVTYLFEKTKAGWRAINSHASLILQPSK